MFDGACSSQAKGVGKMGQDARRQQSVNYQPAFARQEGPEQLLLEISINPAVLV